MIRMREKRERKCVKKSENRWKYDNKEKTTVCRDLE